MEKYKNDIIRLQREIFSYLKNESNLSEESLLDFTPFLMDEACIYRFYKKNQFSFAETKEEVVDHLTWMLNENVFNNTFDSFEINADAYSYLLNGFLYFCGHDKLGRPIGIVNLNHYNGSSDIESLKKYMIFMLEIAQKLIREKNRKNKNSIEYAFINNTKSNNEWDIQTQISIILDLDNLKMSSLNYEIFPTLIKIFINHYPYIAETLYILNYRWIHAGLWGMVKQMLSESITKNMLFLKKNEIFDYIDPDELLVEFGGNNRYKYDCYSCLIYKKYGKRQNITTIPLHLLESEITNVESSNIIDNEEKWYDACSNENETEEITEEIIHKPEVLSPIAFDTSSIKNEPLYPIKETNYLYEDEPVLNISYHPIKLSLKEEQNANNNTNLNNNNNTLIKKLQSPKYFIYAIIRHILMPFYAYVRRVRCTSVYFELILSRWIKKFSDENSIPPSFNYLSFYITNTTNVSGNANTNIPTQNNINIDNTNNNNNRNRNHHNINNNIINLSQATDATSSTSSVTSSTLVSPSTSHINYINDTSSNYPTNYSTYSNLPTSSSNLRHRHHLSSPSQSSSTIFDQSNSSNNNNNNTTSLNTTNTNNGTLSWKDINSLVQHTLKTCLPEYYNPFADSVAILFFFASVTLLTHLIYPRNRYRIYSSFWKYAFKLRRELYVCLGLRPNLNKSIIQVI
ncbi:hypothetical protein BCR32DRAFT_264118 [Anaeromyces robustus]|uniref:CRAL-TRIO domain-containing protein n=1 Tax=Anaeromyces robustus TaxID=1754192 RepID=A0A1Y1XPL8_9FUNG|nr:hypothetical protein BCR32DRAFT_264118 [Anaeromyces robustus]|eukprot:ORX87699.1 hypothetical protein BCR32DRAFT_264118 [Anaeromyces robustus]